MLWRIYSIACFPKIENKKVAMKIFLILSLELYFYSSILVSIWIYLLISIADMHWDIHAINTKQWIQCLIGKRRNHLVVFLSFIHWGSIPDLKAIFQSFRQDTKSPSVITSAKNKKTCLFWTQCYMAYVIFLNVIVGDRKVDITPIVTYILWSRSQRHFTNQERGC